MNELADMRSQDPNTALQITTNLEALIFSGSSHEGQSSAAPVRTPTEDSRVHSIEAFRDLLQTE